MGQKKLIRFAEIKTFANVLEYPDEMKGRWNEHFGNNNPVILELACGKGEYALGLGQSAPGKNFIGVDIKGNRLWRGAKSALERGLSNVAFLRTQIDKIHEYFRPGEVDEIWITFPDPQLRTSKAKKRLTHPKFLRLYQQFLKPKGVVHLKTDSPALYEFTKLVIEIFGLPLFFDTDDVYGLTPVPEELTIKTHYEALDIAGSKRVHYLRFGLDRHLDPSKDDILKIMIRGYDSE